LWGAFSAWGFLCLVCCLRGRSGGRGRRIGKSRWIRAHAQDIRIHEMEWERRCVIWWENLSQVFFILHTSPNRLLARMHARQKKAQEINLSLSCLRSLSYYLQCPGAMLLLVLYASKVKEVPILWVAWSSFWVSKEAPRPRVTPGRRRTL
jgi:hypothetical protein